MADMHFEETCPCGNNTKFSGYSTYVTPQILAWRKIHNPHSNAIAKAVAESKSKIYTFPWTTTTTTPTIAYKTEISSDSSADTRRE